MKTWTSNVIRSVCAILAYGRGPIGFKIYIVLNLALLLWATLAVLVSGQGFIGFTTYIVLYMCLLLWAILSVLAWRLLRE